MKRQVLLIVLGLALAAALAPPPVRASGRSATLVGAFDVGPGGYPQKFNPLTATAGFTWFNKYYSTLTLYDETFQRIEGDLAQSWQVSPEGRRVVFNLRPGVSWHDGQPFTSRDVKFTLDLVRQPELGSPFAARLDALSSVSTPDERTVVLQLRVANSALLDALTQLMIVPAHRLGDLAPRDVRDSDWWKTAPVGTGPFRWGRYLPDQYVELLAYAHYHGGRPRLDRLVNRYFKDPAAAVMALRTGEIHFTYLSPDQMPEVSARAAARVVEGSSQVLNYLGFNHRDPRFADLRVRQAILLAIDRAAIVRSLYGGRASLAHCVYTQAPWVSDDLDRHAHDPARARALLSEAGWARIKGEPIELLTYYNDQVSRDVVAALQAQLAAVGVTIRARFVDGPTYGQITDSGRFSMVLAGAGNGPEPDVLAPMLSSQAHPPQGVNRMRVDLPELDRLLALGRETVEPARRAAVYREICRLTNARLPWAPLWVGMRHGGIGHQVAGMVWWPAPGGGRYRDRAEDWFLRPGAP